MTGGVYFNEIEPIACAVLRDFHPGVVDERSIKEVNPDDVRGFERAHFFAGAGLWQIAADMAGWRGPLWTASCPCQPFSVAGKGAGRDDPRHLWPDFFRLARAVRPPVIVGEQVAGPAGFDWFDGVASDLEGEGYACRAVDIPACAVDAPHRRQRLYWVAVADADGGHASAEREQCRRKQRFEPAAGGHSWITRNDERAEIALADPPRQRGKGERVSRARLGRGELSAGGYCGDGFAMADSDRCGRDGGPQNTLGRAGRRDAAERADGELVDSARDGRDEWRPEHEFRSGRDPATDADGAVAVWSNAEWLLCADGKVRRTPSAESYFRSLADGVPGGVERSDPSRLLIPSFKGRASVWKIAGNAIVPQVAAQVLIALREHLEEARRG